MIIFPASNPHMRSEMVSCAATLQSHFTHGIDNADNDEIYKNHLFSRQGIACLFNKHFSVSLLGKC